jgi:hypothetical protein
MSGPNQTNQSRAVKQSLQTKKIAKKKQKKTKGVSALARQHGDLLMTLIADRKSLGVSLATLKKDIPYILPDFGKGTQYIAVRLYLTVQNITTVAATVYNTVLSIQSSILNNFSDFAGIFDEYRLIKGEIYYQPTTLIAPAVWTGGLGVTCACIDYGIATALGSTTAAASHDTKQFFFLVANPSQKQNPKYGVAKWQVLLERLPDQEWIPVTVNTAVAYWKPYMIAIDSPGAGVTGYLHGWMDVMFRGMSA